MIRDVYSGEHIIEKHREFFRKKKKILPIKIRIVVDFRERAGGGCDWEGRTDGLPEFQAKFYFLTCVLLTRVFAL